MATLTVEDAPPRGYRMSRAEVVEIHRLRADGSTGAEIAARVRRSRSTVDKALRTSPTDWPERPGSSVPPAGSTASSLVTRRARARMRANLIAGHVTLQDVIVPPHRAIADMALVDVVRMQWTNSGRQATPALEQLGRHAVRDGVNLMMASGRASGYSRAWVAEHGSKWARPKAVAS